MAGTFGYELDLTRLTEDEKETVRRQCADYHKYNRIIREGDLYRLISPWKDRNRCAWSYVSPDKREALVTFVVIRCGVYERYYLRLAGLDPELRYRNEATGQILSGSTLMSAGLCIPETLRDHASRVYHLTAVI